MSKVKMATGKNVHGENVHVSRKNSHKRDVRNKHTNQSNKLIFEQHALKRSILDTKQV